MNSSDQILNSAIERNGPQIVWNAIDWLLTCEELIKKHKDQIEPSLANMSMQQNFLIRRLGGSFFHIGNVNTSLFTLKNNSITLLGLFFMNCFVKLIQLLNLKICIGHLVLHKKLRGNNASTISLHTSNIFFFKFKKEYLFYFRSLCVVH